MRAVSLLLLVVALSPAVETSAAFLAAVVAVPPPATLCVAGVCREVGAERITLSPAAEARQFVWIAADASRVIAGIVAAGATAPALADETRAVHRFSALTSDGARRVSASFELRCGDAVWTWSLRELPRAVTELAHPAGECALTVQAPGYKTATKGLGAANVGAIYLHRLPVISGTVADAVTRAPIGRADLFLPGGQRLTSTDADGRFRAPIDGPWPARLRVEATGRAPKSVPVPGAIADTDLPIMLSRGGNVTVSLEPPLGQEAVRWEARRILEGADDEKVRSGEVAAGQSSFSVEGLDPGPYRVIVAGDGPLQRFAAPVMVDEGATASAAVRIESSRLELEVRRAGKPAPASEVEVIFRDGDAVWRSRVSTDDRGQAIEEIWQAGPYLASVAGWSESKRLVASETISWALDLPDRVIRGRLLDAATKQALSGAAVFLEARDEHGSQVSSLARSGADGAYTFESVPAGSYVLTVRADGYETLQTSPAPIAEDTHLETRDLRVHPLGGHTLRVVNSFGVPIPGAAVWIATAAGVRSAGVAKEDGRVVLPLAVNEAGEAFVFPRSGSLAITRFGAMTESGAEELRVVVPDGVSSLEMLTVSTDGEPLPRVPFIIRVNGVVMPGMVYEAMARHQGLPLWSDASGRALLSRMPPGRYEIWPLTSPADRRAVESLAPPPAPVNVMLTPGHHVAKLTFKPKTS